MILTEKVAYNKSWKLKFLFNTIPPPQKKKKKQQERQKNTQKKRLRIYLHVGYRVIKKMSNVSLCWLDQNFTRTIKGHRGNSQEDGFDATENTNSQEHSIGHAHKTTEDSTITAIEEGTNWDSKACTDKQSHFKTKTLKHILSCFFFFFWMIALLTSKPFKFW